MTRSKITPYLFFSGQCEEAIEFYQQAMGATVLMMMRFNESPDAPPPGMLAEGFENKIMHATIAVGDSLLFLSDGCDSNKVDYTGIRISVSFSDPEQVKKTFAELSKGGSVEMELQHTFWSPLFGMLRDPYGIGWMVSTLD